MAEQQRIAPASIAISMAHLIYNIFDCAHRNCVAAGANIKQLHDWAWNKWKDNVEYMRFVIFLCNVIWICIALMPMLIWIAQCLIGSSITAREAGLSECEDPGAPAIRSMTMSLTSSWFNFTRKF